MLCIPCNKNKCIEPNCNKRSNYNFEGEKRGIYCVSHKKDGMINVISKTCEEPNCKKQPAYNFENEKTAIYCNSHKKDGMIDVINKKCEQENCNKRPIFNYENEKQGIYCVSHKKDGMVDIISKTCQEPNCKTKPTYNYENEKRGIYCNSHKKDGMINVIDKTCQEPNCKKLPTYNYENEKTAIYCNSHKKDGMIDIKNKRCKTHLCYTIPNPKYKGYCLRCFMHLFPNEPNTRNYKTKESSVSQYIKSKFPQLEWVFDKIISGGCSRRRPDIYLDLNTKVIIIEIDENQHTNYDCSCENRRLMEISQDFAHRPIIFIRFNPDDYLHNNVKNTSCWGINKNGICCVKKSKKEEWDNRLECLFNNVNYWIDNESDKMIEVVQLFYDTL
jgi:hypothetical protein